MLPSLWNQSGDLSTLHRLLGSNGNMQISINNKLSPETRNAQQRVLDSMLDPCSVEGMAAMTVQEPRRSSCFANLQKLRAELSNEPAVAATNDFCETNKIINVRPNETATEQRKDNINVPEQEQDSRPLKSLHWKALTTSVTEYKKQHKCEGNSWTCEKCRRVNEIKKATERFEAKRAAKQILQESRSNIKVRKNAENDEAADREQKIKREERFCRISPPNARTVAQRSKTAAVEGVSFFPAVGSLKWAQPVLSEMPNGVLTGSPIDNDSHTETTFDEDIKLERDESSAPSCMAEMKFLREYLDDEPDFESQKIESWELAPRSRVNVVFIPPGWCEEMYEASEPPEPTIRIIDTSIGDNDAFSNTTEGRGIASLRKLLSGKNQATEVLKLRTIGDKESWSDVVITLKQLDEKDGARFECDSEEKSHSEENAFC